jgi:hypothetical protein
MHPRMNRAVLAGLLALTPFCLSAQPVYKCQSKGSVVYSHEPCIAAQVVDTTPSQGLDKSSGKSMKGADVLRSEQNKAMAEALRPLLGESPAEYEKRHRRFKLSPSDRSECASLDGRMAGQEADARNAEKGAAMRAEAALFDSRKRYRELRC